MEEKLKKDSEKPEEKISEEEKKNSTDEGEKEPSPTLQERYEQFKKIDSFKTNKKSFATGVGFYKLFWVFFIGCFVGVVIEVLFCIFVTEHRYESRQGLIYGPFNPVYGFGAVAMTLVLYLFRRKSETWIFLVGAIIGAIFETLCSVYQEYFLGTVSWDYSDSKFRLMGGRTDLVYAVFWGILAVIWIKFIYPFMSKWIEKIPNKVGIILTWILLVFMVFDCVISCMAVDRMVKRYNGTADDTAVGRFLDEHYPDEFLLKVYPNMIFTETGEVLHEVAGDEEKEESSQESSENNTTGQDESAEDESKNSFMVDLFSLYPFNS